MSSLLTAATICAELRADPTESHLSDLVDAHDYHCLPSLDHDPDAVGHILVAVADGWLLLPAIRLDPATGWETLDVDRAQLLPSHPAWADRLAAYWQALEALRDLTLDQLQHARPVPCPTESSPA